MRFRIDDKHCEKETEIRFDAFQDLFLKGVKTSNNYSNAHERSCVHELSKSKRLENFAWALQLFLE